MALKMTRSEKIAFNKTEKRIERSYYAGCSGVEIDIMDIGKVFKHGRLLVEAGADDATLQAAIKAYVETIRHN